MKEMLMQVLSPANTKMQEEIRDYLISLAEKETEDVDGFGPVPGFSENIMEGSWTECLKYVKRMTQIMRYRLKSKDLLLLQKWAALDYYYDSYDETAKKNKEVEKALKNPKASAEEKVYADFIAISVEEGSLDKNNVLDPEYSLKRCFNYVSKNLREIGEEKDKIIPPTSRVVFHFIRKFYAMDKETIVKMHEVKKFNPKAKTPKKSEDVKESVMDTAVVIHDTPEEMKKTSSMGTVTTPSVSMSADAVKKAPKKAKSSKKDIDGQLSFFDLFGGE